MARLYREAPVNAIWEGSGNVNALDVLRALGRDPLPSRPGARGHKLGSRRLGRVRRPLDGLDADTSRSRGHGTPRAAAGRGYGPGAAGLTALRHGARPSRRPSSPAASAGACGAATERCRPGSRSRRSSSGPASRDPGAGLTGACRSRPRSRSATTGMPMPSSGVWKMMKVASLPCAAGRSRCRRGPPRRRSHWAGSARMPARPTSLTSILSPSPDGRSTPSGASTRRMRLFWSAVFKTMHRQADVGPVLGGDALHQGALFLLAPAGCRSGSASPHRVP